MKIIQAKKNSPNSSPRNGKIKGFTLHHFAGKMNPKAATEFWQTASGAPNYSVHNDGTIMQHVQDNRRAWTSGYKNWYGAANDHETLTVEIENETIGGDWAVSDKALKSVIWLIATKFEEYGIDNAYFTGVMTKGKTSGFGDLGTIRGHKQVAPTECPGNFLWARMNYVADEVNKLLNPTKPTKPNKGELKVEKIPTKPVIVLNKNTSMWAFDANKWADIKPVKKFKKGDEIEVADIVTNKLGGRYYRSVYSSKNNILHGFNVVDCTLIYKG